MSAHIGLVLVQGVLPLVGIYLMKLIVDTIAEGVSSGDADLAWSRLLMWVGFAAGVAFVGAVLRVVGGVVAEAHGRAVSDRVAEQLHYQSTRLDLGYYENPEYYDTLHRAQAEAPHRPIRIVQDLASTGQALVTLVGMVGLLMALHWAVPIVVTLAAIPAVLFRLRHARRMYEWQQKRTPDQREAGYLSGLMTSRSSAKDLRLFNLGDILAGRFSRIRDRLRGELLGLSLRRGRADLVAQVLSSSVLFGAYLLIGWLTLQGVTTLGDLVMYAQAIQRAQGAVGGLLGSMAGLFENSMFLAHFFSFLDLKPLVASPTEARSAPTRPAATIHCEGLCFTYPGQTKPVLDGLDLTLRSGELVAIVGSNGAGKSTLVKLLCRLYDPSAGRILLDGINICDYEPTVWRRQLSVLFQDATPFEFSARDNITAFDADADGEDGREYRAAVMTGAHDRLTGLSKGYDTLLGRRFEGAEELSAGEWRKVLLARALYRDTSTVLLDEPLAFVDPRAGAEILTALRELKKDRVVLIVSHRPELLVQADRVCLLREGRIAETGTHEALISSGSEYARLLGLAPGGGGQT